MYTLYYLTKNWALNCMKVDSLDVCIPIPEDLIFVACRNGINFIKEPAEKLSFTDVERLIMSTEFYDTNFIKDEDFRKANSQMCPIQQPPPSSFNIETHDFDVQKLPIIGGVAFALNGNEDSEFINEHSIIAQLFSQSGTLLATYGNYPPNNIVWDDTQQIFTISVLFSQIPTPVYKVRFKQNTTGKFSEDYNFTVSPV